MFNRLNRIIFRYYFVKTSISKEQVRVLGLEAEIENLLEDGAEDFYCLIALGQFIKTYRKVKFDRQVGDIIMVYPIGSYNLRWYGETWFLAASSKVKQAGLDFLLN